MFKWLRETLNPIIGSGIPEKNLPEVKTATSRIYRRRVTEDIFGVDNDGGKYDDKYFTALSGGEADHIDIDPDKLRLVQQYSLLAYRQNPRAHSYVEIMTDFVVGDGMMINARDPRVLAVLKEHWEENQWDTHIKRRVRAHTILGELILAPRVEPGDDIIKVGAINPLRVAGVRRHELDDEHVKTLFLRYPTEAEPDKVVEADLINRQTWKTFKSLGSKSMGSPVKVFFITANQISGASRGYPDLGCVLDWLSGIDAFAFTLLERSDVAMNMVWDLLLEGVSDDAKMKDKTDACANTIRQGGVYGHNDKSKLECITPKLAAFEAKEVFEVMARQVYGGTRFPGMFFGDSSDLTRASATELSIGASRKLGSRQKDLAEAIIFLLKTQIEYTRATTTKLDDVTDFSFTATFPKILLKDLVLLSKTLLTLSEALDSAEISGRISRDRSQSIFNEILREVTNDTSDSDSEFDDSVEVLDDDIPADLAKTIANSRKDIKKIRRERQAKQGDLVPEGNTPAAEGQPVSIKQNSSKA